MKDNAKNVVLKLVTTCLSYELFSGVRDHCRPKTFAADRRLHDVRRQLPAPEPYRDGWWQLSASADVVWVVSAVLEKRSA